MDNDFFRYIIYTLFVLIAFKIILSVSYNFQFFHLIVYFRELNRLYG